MTTTRIDPKGKTVFISGANRGIGKAIAIEFLEQGAAKVYAGARKVANLEALQAAYPDRLIPVALDVTDDASIKNAASIGNGVEILVNNAGIFSIGGILKGDTNGSLKTNLDINVWGIVKLSNALKEQIFSADSAAIINISSVAGLGNMPMAATYSVSKAAVHSITQGMRGETAQDNILVMGVYPGPIDTDMAKDLEMDKDSPENVAKNILEGLKSGTEDIFPDVMSEQIGGFYAANPKGVEQQFAGFVGE